MFKPKKLDHKHLSGYGGRIWASEIPAYCFPYLCETSKNWILVWDMKAGMERSRKLQEHILKQHRRTSYDMFMDVIDGQTVALTAQSTIRVGYFDNPVPKAEAARDSKFAPKLTLNLWWAVASWQASDMRLINAHHRRPWLNWDMEHIYSSSAARPHRNPFFQDWTGFDSKPVVVGLGHNPQEVLDYERAIWAAEQDNHGRKSPGCMVIHPDQERLRRIINNAHVGARAKPLSLPYKDPIFTPAQSELDLPLFAHIALLKGLRKK